MPTTLFFSGYGGKSIVKITNITYKIYRSSVDLYLTGEKTYDARGDKYSDMYDIAWKLYDSEGYVIDGGIYYTKMLIVGDKFRDAEITIQKTLEVGETYTLEIF